MKCEYCNKNLSTKQTLKRHLEICKEKKEVKVEIVSDTNIIERIIEIENIIKDLQDEIHELKDKPLAVNIYKVDFSPAIAQELFEKYKNKFIEEQIEMDIKSGRAIVLDDIDLEGYNMSKI